MSRRKPNLKSALSAVVDDDESTQPDVPVKTKTAGVKSTVPPSRQGKKFIGAYFDPEVSKQLRFMAVESDKTNQALLAEALNLLFAKYKKNPIAR